MVPMSAVIGGVTDGGAPYMATYYLTGNWLGNQTQAGA
jgi:hypothetical protein